jgi:4-aminobutyrate aminotransferase
MTREGFASDDDTNRSELRLDWQRRNLDETTRALLTRDADLFLHQALSTPCLNALRRAEGIWFEDVAGRRYMDFHGNNVHHIGYAHPRLIAALKAQLDELCFSPRRYTNATTVALAEALNAVAPSGLAKCLLAPSGNDAMEIALQLARGATGRHKTIGFWGAFHGAGVAASSVGGEAMFRGAAAGPLLPGASHVPPPTCYRCPFGAAPAQGCCELSAQLIRYVLEQEGDVAAVVASPVHGAEYVPPVGFWRQVEQACAATGALLVFDEVQTGLGKTGRMFACQHYDVAPDILVLGKALGGGVVPLAAVLCRADLDVLGEAAIGHYTHEKSALLARAGLETLAIVHEEGLIERAATLGRYALQQAEGLADRHPLVGDVRGLGLQLGIDLVLDRTTRAPARQAAERIMYLALERGLSLKISAGSTLALSPPLIIEQPDLDAAFAILDACLAEVEAGPDG